jgi:hypothetical protein
LIGTSERFAALADEAPAETTLRLQERGFSVEVVDDLDAPSRPVGQTR